MNIADIERAGQEILALLRDYHNPPQRELLLDAILYAMLFGRHTKITRQHRVYLYGSTRPQRIDFRLGGSNPVVMEFAIRTNASRGTLYGTQNVSELRKLCRVRSTAARLRVLLLLDLSSDPLDLVSLKDTYEPLHAGRGRFRRSPVRVIYVHTESSFNFLWRPYA